MRHPKRRSGNALLWGGFFALLFLAMLIAGNFLHWFQQGEYPQIILPTAPLTAPSSGAPSSPSGGAVTPAPTSIPPIQVDVTVDNVRDIVAGRSQPTEYQCVWQVEWFWQQGSRTAKRRVFVRDGYIKTEIFDADGQPQQQLISGGGRVYIYSPGVIWQPERGDFTAENGASLPSFDFLSMLDNVDILTAGYLSPCIVVTFRAADSTYVDTYWLSWADGLPVQMERSFNGQLAIRCTRESLELSRPGDENFRLPNNQFPWEND